MAELAVAATVPAEAIGAGVAGAASLESAAAGVALETGAGAALETGGEVITPEIAAAGGQLGGNLTEALQVPGAEPEQVLAELAATAPDTPAGADPATALEIGPDGIPVAQAANSPAGSEAENPATPGEGANDSPEAEGTPDDAAPESDAAAPDEEGEEPSGNENDKPLDNNEAEKLQNELQQLIAEKNRLLMQNNDVSTIVATELRAFTAAEATIINSNNARMREIDSRIAAIQGRIQQETVKNPGSKDSLAMMALLLMLTMAGSIASASK